MNITGSTSDNIFHLIKDQYGVSILAKIRRLERLRIKYGKFSNHLRFSLRCLHSDLLPNDLRLKCKVPTKKARDICNRAGRLLLQERIHINDKKRKSLKNQIEIVESELKETLTSEQYEGVKSIHDFTASRESENSKERQVQKFERLLTRKEKENHNNVMEKVVDKDKWIINLSEKQLSDGAKSLLLKGMKFAITPKYIPKEEIIAKVESSLKGIDKPEADTIRAKVSLTLQKAKCPKDNLTRNERTAMKELMNDDSILILPADKGRATVILKREDYFAKCNEHIDNGPYEYLKRDPTESIKRECLKKLKKLKDQNIIDQTLYFKLKPTDSPAPRFYGLPKIHKQGTPIRPIVSYTGTPLYNISKYVAGILSRYVSKEGRHSENSKVFSEYIRTIKVEDDEILVSFDVTSLYTNVPIKDTLEIIKGLLENDADLQAKTPIPPTELLEIVEFLLTKTWFKFNGKFLTQKDGVAMGGPASSVVAEIYMQEHDKKSLSTFPSPPKCYERFVDDTFTIIKRSVLHPFFDHMNSLHPKIQFTIEEENDGSLPFLDTLLKRNNDGTISVLVYRKPTHTDQYLQFTSNHPSSTKDAVMSSLFRRAKEIVSDENDLKRENERISNVLSENGYSVGAIKRVRQKLSRPNVQQDAEQTGQTEQVEQTRYISIPYIAGTSETLRRVFASHNIKCAFYSNDTLRKYLSKPKDTIPADQNNNIVYKIPCGDCEATYIGETKRSFKQRSSEHIRAVKNRDIEKNEIADHCWEKDHNMDWDSKKVIDRERNIYARKIKETIHSLKDQNHINSISYQLPDIWLPNITQRE